jgi:hypothetical protein
MSLIFMVFHWPEPGRADTLARSMREMRDVFAGVPRFGIPLWPPDEIVEGETRPRERFFLEEVETARP